MAIRPRTSKATNCLDPNHVPETLCLGMINVSRTGRIAILTFTHARPDAQGLMIDRKINLELIVRARIVTSIENLANLRDMINDILKEQVSLTAPTHETKNWRWAI
jgi:hypothetical protein